MQAIFGQKIGILTTNITTIVYVVTLSHLVFMTFNWQTLASDKDNNVSDGRCLAKQASRMTFPASFWSMVCSSLGFASLLIVAAKPTRELGIGGVAGTITALACAYLMYPAFLAWTKPEQTYVVMKDSGSTFWGKRWLLHIPVDNISVPANNICIGMAIDSMVHLIFGVRRAQRDGKTGWDAWVAGRQELCAPAFRLRNKADVATVSRPLTFLASERFASQLPQS